MLGHLIEFKAEQSRGRQYFGVDFVKNKDSMLNFKYFPKFRGSRPFLGSGPESYCSILIQDEFVTKLGQTFTYKLTKYRLKPSFK